MRSLILAMGMLTVSSPAFAMELTCWYNMLGE